MTLTSPYALPFRVMSPHDLGSGPRDLTLRVHLAETAHGRSRNTRLDGNPVPTDGQLWALAGSQFRRGRPQSIRGRTQSTIVRPSSGR